MRTWHRHHTAPAGQISAVGAADKTGILHAVVIVERGLVGRDTSPSLFSRQKITVTEGHQTLARPRPQAPATTPSQVSPKPRAVQGARR